MAETRPLNRLVYEDYLRPFLDRYVEPAIDAASYYVPPGMRKQIAGVAGMMPTPDTVTPTRNALTAYDRGQYGTAAVEGVNALLNPLLMTPLAAELVAARAAKIASGGNGLRAIEQLPSTRDYGTVRQSKYTGYDPPPVAPRPYEADYPTGGRGYDPSRPFTSPEGAVINALFVAGRRGYGAPDQGLLPGESSELSRLLTGSVPQGLTKAELPSGAVGTLRLTPGPDRTTRVVGFDKELSGPKRERVIAHEVGHVIDDATGMSYAPYPKRETAKVYSDLFTGQAHRTRQLTGPQHVGYKPSEVDGEFIAEAVRAYMMNPSYLKGVAPKTARMIREFVNTHPTLSKVIQFNTLAAAALPAMEDR